MSYRLAVCEVCGLLKRCCEHHIAHRRYSDQTIWICDLCHAKVHNPTAFNLPADWAYENGYLIRHNASYKITMKEPKKKACTHSKTYFNAASNSFKCNYCGKIGLDMAVSTKTKKPASVETGAKPAKIGYDKQDPRIAQAESLKQKLTSLNVSIKRGGTKEEIEAFKKEKAETVKAMRDLQNTFED